MGQDITDNTLIPITLKISDINTILTALQELPAKIANPLSNILIEQSNAEISRLKDEE